MTRWWAFALLAGCGSGAQPAVSPNTAPCPAADTTTGRRIASVFIDGERIAAGLRARLVQPDPESFELEDAEPPGLAALPAARIDLLQFVRGAEAEREYRLCPGGVAFLVTTKPGSG